MLLVPILLIALPVILWVAYIVSAKTYRGLVKNNSKFPRAIQAIVFLVCAAALFGMIGYFLLNNVSMER